METTKTNNLEYRVLWSTDDYTNEESMDIWWNDFKECNYKEATGDDVCNKLGIDPLSLSSKEKEAINVLLPAYIKADKERHELKEVDTELWNEVVNDDLDFLRDILAEYVDGVIVGFFSLGLWNGRHKGAKILGEKISNILTSECEFVTWYAQDNDIHGKMSHHDGNNYVLYRICENYERAQEIIYLYTHCNKDLDDVKKLTRNLYDDVAPLLGWDNK